MFGEVDIEVHGPCMTQNTYVEVREQLCGINYPPLLMWILDIKLIPRYQPPESLCQPRTLLKEKQYFIEEILREIQNILETNVDHGSDHQSL